MTNKQFSDERICVVEDLAGSVGQLWRDLQNKNKQKTFFVAAPISNTPYPLYQWVIKNANDFYHWENFQFLLMDDQVIEAKNGHFSYIPLSNAANFENKIKEMFLGPLEEKIAFPVSKSVLKPDLQDLSSFDTELTQHQGIDLLILAIGEGGHYAQVMPSTKETVGFHISELMESYKKRHETSGSFKDSQFQKSGMSLGPRQVLEAKNVIVIVNGERKREVTKELLSSDSFHPEFPLSIIYHPVVYKKVKIFLTPEVLSK
jgi:6-phosphogluconolactonase/glucosamine-6-phosphate isomerase/deaminase